MIIDDFKDIRARMRGENKPIETPVVEQKDWMCKRCGFWLAYQPKDPTCPICSVYHD